MKYNYKYKDEDVLAITKGIITQLEKIIKLDFAYIEDALIGIEYDDHDVIYIDNDDYIDDDLNGQDKYFNYKVYCPLELNMIRYDSNRGKYAIYRQIANNVANEFIVEENETYEEVMRDAKAMEEEAANRK
jgi:hypothetical protein